MVFKSIKTKQILPYFTEFNQHYVLLVYRDFEPKSYPKIMEYLHFYEKELKNRYDYKNNNIRWFEIAQIRNKDIFESKLKILCPYKAVEPRFALDTNQFITSIDISLILPLSIDPLLLLVYLNHPLVKQYIKLKAKKIDGRKVELYPEFLRHLPIKDFLLDKNPISNQIIQEMNKIENFCAPVSDITKSIISQCENLLNKLFKENGWKNE